MKQKIKYITKSDIASINEFELDMELYEELGIDIENEVVNTISRVSRTADGFPINIDRLIGIFTKYKKMGATYVSIEHNIDHYGYTMDMIKFNESTLTEIQEYNDNQYRQVEIIKDYKGIPIGSSFDAVKVGDNYTGRWSSVAGSYAITVPIEFCKEIENDG